METAKHTHSFCVDTSCECGVVLSDYVRSLVAINAELLAALKKFMEWLDKGLLVRDITKDHQSDWAMKMMHFVNDLNKARAAIQKAESK